MKTTLATVAILVLLTSDAIGQPAAAARAAQARQTVPVPESQVSASRPPVALPRVRLIATGGTIANRAGGRLTADELVASVPRLSAFVRPESEQFANVSSTELTLAQWLGLARRATALFRDPALAGLVVTSGTDTLEETAYFLHLTVKDDRPVVVVGAMRPPDAVGYEGAANLLAAFRVAADPQSRGKGVLVVLNDEINSARDVSKTDTLRLHTFQARGFGELGVVDEDRVVYYGSPLKRHTSRSEFDVSTIDVLPRIDILMVYQDAAGDLIKAAVDRGAKGLVIASAGAGSLSGDQAKGVDYALDRGLVVVVSSRTGGGRIPPHRPGNRRGTVLAEDLAPLKARVLLMLALSVTDDRIEIQRMFTEY